MEARELREYTKLKLSEMFDGFNVKVNSNGFSLVKIEDSIMYEFGGNFRTYPGKLICDSINAGINFLEIEKILTPILIEAGIKGNKTAYNEQWTIKISDNHLLGKTKFDFSDIIQMEIDSKSDVDRLVESLYDFYLTHINLFFNEWDSLGDFKGLLDDMPPRELAKIFGAGGIFKKAVIYYILEDSNYIPYVEKLVKNFKEAHKTNPNEINYSRFLAAAELVLEALDSRS